MRLIIYWGWQFISGMNSFITLVFRYIFGGHLFEPFSEPPIPSSNKNGCLPSYLLTEQWEHNKTSTN
jgi:hypothetical protein